MPRTPTPADPEQQLQPPPDFPGVCWMTPQPLELDPDFNLLVPPGFEAVAVTQGQAADVLTTGSYPLTTDELPITTTLHAWEHHATTSILITWCWVRLDPPVRWTWRCAQGRISYRIHVMDAADAVQAFIAAQQAGGTTPESATTSLEHAASQIFDESTALTEMLSNALSAAAFTPVLTELLTPLGISAVEVEVQGPTPTELPGAPRTAADNQPDAAPTQTAPADTAWFLGINGHQAGPFDLPTVTQRAAEGIVTHHTLVWRAGMSDWLPAGKVPEVAAVLTPTSLAATTPS